MKQKLWSSFLPYCDVYLCKQASQMREKSRMGLNCFHQELNGSLDHCHWLLLRSHVINILLEGRSYHPTLRLVNTSLEKGDYIFFIIITRLNNL